MKIQTKKGPNLNEKNRPNKDPKSGIPKKKQTQEKHQQITVTRLGGAND